MKPEALPRNLHSSAVMVVSGMQQRQIVLSVGKDKRILGYDAHVGRQDFMQQVDSKCMSVLPNPHDFNLFMVQTGTPERQLRLFDIRSKRTELHGLGWKQESSESQSALINQAWSPNGVYISSGSADPMIHIFDIRYNAHKPSNLYKLIRNESSEPYGFALFPFSFPYHLISTLGYTRFLSESPTTRLLQPMGNCCSDIAGGRTAVGGTASGQLNPANGPNEAVDNFLRSRGYNGLFSQIELSFSATGLRDRDIISKSDPMLVLYERGKNGALKEVGRTEVILNSLNPTWITKHTLTYQFEAVQDLVFRVYDVDTQFHNADVKILKLEEQEYLGEATCALSESRNCGKLLVHAEECVSSKTTVEMTLRCSDLEYRDLFSKSDPFLLISKVVEGGSHIPICKTEVIKNDHNPIWKPVFLNIQQIGSKENPMIMECYNFNSNGKHDLMGKVQKSLMELEKLFSSGQGVNFFLSSAGGHNSHNKVLKSRLFVDKYVESVQHSFLDYLAGGFELNFMVAVDFTASNGNPRLPDSLHYNDPSGRPNAYQRAILEVGEVLQYYDSDKRFPTWGFGARPIDGPVSHCFNLNGSSHYCEVEGIQGIMKAYTSALLNVSLAGPTLFGPVISNAALIASQSSANGDRKYFVLLIITDGVVTDLQETKDALVKASDLPLSILIVGVGGADFKEMEILDADKGEKLESSSGRVASRDIVQFVPFRDVQSGEISVVQALLAELPTQFLTYMRSRSIQPSV
ncbi:unnamed protein product [Sphenostylis stenocarpa]|uniref:Uncharacterized protein n=1 Tax=Sphenostylis stenocarpa TaxID=92480 RepID=A0AA86VEK6_9FABA|nr:unnamed protein product [Sphenostylis stenocarpa]